MGETHVVEGKTSTISCSVSPLSITQEKPFTVSGSINPAVSGARIIITFKNPDGSTFTRTVITGLDGSFSDSYHTTEIGSWSVEASWEGDQMHEGASSQQITFTVNEKIPVEEEKKGCIIATATYGSELAPEVQFLRGFRDNTVLNTFVGKNFMTVFNAWYYSFSPGVASIIAVNETLRGFMKILLYPLIGILHIAASLNTLFSFNHEIAILTSGFVASSMIGIVYLGPIALAVHRFKNVKTPPGMLQVGLYLWMVSVGGIILAEIARWPGGMMFSTTTFVLTTMSLTTLSSMKYIMRARSIGCYSLESLENR
jgi:hypothetical protein